MGDLAEALVITRGGLTKLVDRLVKAGPPGAGVLRDGPQGQLRAAAGGWGATSSRRCGRWSSPSCGSLHDQAQHPAGERAARDP